MDRREKQKKNAGKMQIKNLNRLKADKKIYEPKGKNRFRKKAVKAGM